MMGDTMGWCLLGCPTLALIFTRYTQLVVK